ncbi:hypothetical protein H8K32_04745 [Undibacterium jejuense]|uniref:Uncharacterized protein n=1 Tax=Undibacterium jejuense TaxID=1344949 RepID=A0A923HCW5_9BURK|nr:hypothetical protein [Undibacterium jejuense]MBC3861399.1 hypothetical protein [Undibacterium jejuense]
MKEFPATIDLLVSGGDSRITPNPQTGLNKYGCSTLPDNELTALGSSTASVISLRGMTAAQALRNRCAQLVLQDTQQHIYDQQIRALRSEFLSLCGLSEEDKVDALFAASGTDIHLLLAQWLQPDLTVMIDPAETGSGLAAALQGKHFSSDSTCAGGTPEGAAVSDWRGELLTLAARSQDGKPRDIASVDAELLKIVEQAVKTKKRLLLILTDVCKTGLIFPGIASIKKLQQRWPDQIQVVVDACQFRLSKQSLRAYLVHHFCVALTGSKFLGGPTFSGALLIPHLVANICQERILHEGARAYSHSADWPSGYKASLNLHPGTNFGLLLRWEAAMAELREFAQLNEQQIRPFLQAFRKAVSDRIQHDPHFEAVSNPALDRSEIGSAGNWDEEQTIFPFVIYRILSNGEKRPLTRSESAKVYQELQQPADAQQHRRFQLGQPVLCGERMGTPVSALRICISAPMLVSAQEKLSAEKIITEALLAFERIVEIIDTL